MCSQAGDTANNSLQLEDTRGTVMCLNHPPPLLRVLGDNVPFMFDGADSTDISGVVRLPIGHPAMTQGYLCHLKTRGKILQQKL